MPRFDLPRLLFRTLLVLVPLLAALLLGLFSAHRQNGLYRMVFGIWEEARTAVEEIPNLRRTRPIHVLSRARQEGEGVTVNAADAGDLVLLSGFLGEDHGVRLMTRDGSVLASWRLRISELLDPAACRTPPATDWNAIPHGTRISPAGEITLSYESCGTVRLDRCGRVLWRTGDYTHHSPNLAADGGVVVAGSEYVAKDIPYPYNGPYWEDLVLRFSPEGKLVLRRSATAIFRDNGLLALLNAGSAFEPLVDGEFHLNDVEELSPERAAAFPMFRAGDLLLSFRNLNLVMVTDAAAERVKWWRTGPWIRQHDPDFGADGWISVFDNHADGTLRGTREGGSRILAVHPGTGETRVLYGGSAAQLFYTDVRGTHERQTHGGILIVEAVAGRAFQTDASGRIVWEYVNRREPGWVTWLHDASARPREYFTVGDWSCP